MIQLIQVIPIAVGFFLIGASVGIVIARREQMTDEELEQWVREQIAVLLINIKAYDEYGEEKEYTLKDFSPIGQRAWLNRANRILNLKKLDGTPAIGIISDDQELPKFDHHWFERPDEYIRGMDKMLTAGFYRLVGGKK